MASCSQTGIYIYSHLLISTAFVVVSRVGCLGVTAVSLTVVRFKEWLGVWLGGYFKVDEPSPKEEDKIDESKNKRVMVA